MILNIQNRTFYFLGAAVCLFFLSLAYLLEFGFHQPPCSLCLLQRYALWAIGFIFLIAGFHNSPHQATRYVYNGLLIFFILLGLGLSLRHVWIQHLPADQLPNCTAGLLRLIEFQPIVEALGAVLTGGGECAHSDFKILGLSLAEGSLMVFSGLLIYSLFLLVTTKKRR